MSPAMNEKKLKNAITAFVNNKKVNSTNYVDNWAEYKERKPFYQSFNKNKLLAMTEEDCFEYTHPCQINSLKKTLTTA